MRTSVPRRTLLTSTAVGSAVGAAALLAPTAALAGPGGGRPAASARFTVNAEVLDGGEQVVSLTLRSQALPPVRKSSLSTSTFSVHVRAVNPLDGAVAYEQDRTVTDARFEGGGIVLDLEHGEGVAGGGTLLYTRGRNVLLDLQYTITQDEPLLHNGNSRAVVIESFEQGELSDPEVDAFSYHQVDGGLNYRLFTPSGGRGRKKALVVWLHGGGEGGLITPSHSYYDNEAPLRANRGALGFATAEAQEIFGGAYVVAPQATSAWMQDGDGFDPMIQAVIDEVVANESIDVDRIHVTGCSNGGYMSLKMVAEHPGAFASQVPICAAADVTDPGSGIHISEDAMRAMSATPTWLVAARTDTTIDPLENTVVFHELIDGSIMSLYENVERDGHEFPGHWSWIYVARNDPQFEGVHLWEWMADQSL
ncbi:prolyl oligopeptidase family serine peptidase [Brachybacterium hainanense]|uniref:Prolyl oligopeptidase family serine peptidase n=1 Tax=Brachybacterium hainanense TaxID=1541174 RepID=A0ABV6RFX1_9MICO